MDRNKREILAWKDRFNTYGHNNPKEDALPFYTPEDTRVPHEDVDNDDLRKQTNRERHSSYKR